MRGTTGAFLGLGWDARGPLPSLPVEDVRASEEPQQLVLDGRVVEDLEVVTSQRLQAPVEDDHEDLGLRVEEEAGDAQGAGQPVLGHADGLDVHAVGVEDDVAGGVEALDLHVDLAAEGEVLHEGAQHQVVVEGAQVPGQAQVSPGRRLPSPLPLLLLFLVLPASRRRALRFHPSAPRGLPRGVVTVQPGASRGGRGAPVARPAGWAIRRGASAAAGAAAAAALLDAHAEQDGDHGDHQQGQDGDGEAQHQALVHRDVPLRGAGSHGRRVRPLAREPPAAVPQGGVLFDHHGREGAALLPLLGQGHQRSAIHGSSRGAPAAPHWGQEGMRRSAERKRKGEGGKKEGNARCLASGVLSLPQPLRVSLCQAPHLTP